MSLIEDYDSSDSEQEQEQEQKTTIPTTAPVKEEEKEEKEKVKSESIKVVEKKLHGTKRKCDLPGTDDLFEEHNVPDFLRKSKEFCPTEKELLVLDDTKKPAPQKKPKLNFMDTHGPLEPPREITQNEINKYALAGTRRGVPRATEELEDESKPEPAEKDGKDANRRDGGKTRDIGHKSTTSEKEKRKLGKRQNEWRNNSSNGYWKSDEEMKLRQQYD